MKRLALRAVVLLGAPLAVACGGDGRADSRDAGALLVDAAASLDASAASGPDALEADGFSEVAATGDADTGEVGGGAADARTPGRLVAFASGYGPNLFTFSVDAVTGGLSPLASIAAFGQSPSFLAHHDATASLYAVDENATGRVGAYAIDRASGTLSFLNAVSSGGSGPAFVGVDGTGKFVFVANYGDGSVSVLPVGPGGRLGAASDTRVVGAQAHMVVADPSNRFVLVPCKGAGYVAQFSFDVATGTLTPSATPHVATATGAGPRHLAFHPGGRLAYLVNETNSTLTAYAFDTASGTLAEIETTTTLPAGFSGTNTAAEVWVHPSGRWVLASNRGDDSIVAFAIDPVTGKMTLSGFTRAGGATPRSFGLDPTGGWLYVADQGSGLVVPFRFDAVAGSLSPLGGAVSVPAASYVGVGSL